MKKESSIFNTKKVYVFSDCVLCLGKILENPESNEAWKKRIEWITSSQSYRDLDGISGEPTAFEWNIFPGFTTLQLYGKITDRGGSEVHRNTETWTESTVSRWISSGIFSLDSRRWKSKVYCKDWEKHQRISQEDLSSRRCSTTSRFSNAKRFGTGQWSFLGPGSEKKWYSISEDGSQGEWDNMAERMMLEFAESGHPIFRAASPLSRGRLKSKGHGRLSIHYCAYLETIETIFASLFL